MKNKNIGLAVALLLFSLFFLLSPSSTKFLRASSTIEIDPSYQKGESEFLASLPTLPEENEFSKLESGAFKRTYSFNFPPFFESEVKFNKNKQVYSPGEIVTLKGDIKYSGDNAKNESTKVKERCLETWKEKDEKTKGILCPDYEIYKIPKIEHLKLFVQVWKVDKTENRSKNGDFLVDEFYTDDNFSLTENEKNPTSFNWTVPKGAENGEYYFSFFVNSNKNFPVVSWIQNIFSPLHQEPFEVTGGGEAGIFLVKDQISLNENHYFPIQRTPTIEPIDGKINIKTFVKNSSLGSDKVSLSYKLFSWTQENEKNILLNKKEEISLEKGEIKPIEFSYNDFAGESVNTLQIEAISSSGKSVMEIPFVIANKNKARLMFLGQAEKDGKLYPYACAQYNAWKGNFKGKISIEAFSKENNLLGRWSQSGTISFQDAFCFVLDGNGFENIKKDQCFVLKGKILDETGKTVFEDEVPCNCEVKNKKTEEPTSLGNVSKEKEGINKAFWIYVLFFGLFIISLLLLILNNNNNKNKNE